MSVSIAQNLERLRQHVAALEARMGLAVMRRVQIEGPHDNAQWGYQPC